MTFAATLPPDQWRAQLEALAARADALRGCDDAEAHAAVVVSAVGLLWPGWTPSLIAASCRASAWTGSPVVIAPPLATAVMEADDLHASIARTGLVKPQRSWVMVAPPDRPELAEEPLQRPQTRALPIEKPCVPPPPPAAMDGPRMMVNDLARQLGLDDGRSLRPVFSRLKIERFADLSGRRFIRAADADRVIAAVQADPSILLGRSQRDVPPAGLDNAVLLADVADQLGLGRSGGAVSSLARLAERCGVGVVVGVRGQRWVSSEAADRLRELTTVGLPA